MALIRFLILFLVKWTARILLHLECRWVEGSEKSLDDIRLGVLLNHTSLFEPLYCGVFPNSFLWKIARHGNFPAADITVSRPLVGFFIRLLAPNVISITRKRDDTWKEYLQSIRPETLVLIAAEGRMKRPSGLDKEGKPMTVKGGVVDILEIMKTGKMLIGYSGGLHHIHTPGQRFPKFFKRAVIVLEKVDIADYLKQSHSQSTDFRHFIIQDLEARRDRYCPTLNPDPSHC